MTAAYQSARERLLRLASLCGPFFTGSALSTVFGFGPGTVRQTLHRWAREGLIIAVGERADVYRNTYHPDHGRAVEAAVLTLHPSALVVGHQVLYEAGVTAQVPQLIDIVTRNRGAGVFGYRIHVLAPAAHAALARQLQPVAIGAIPRVTPRRAFAAAQSLGILKLEEDDIEWEAMPELPTARRRQAA